MFKYIVHSHVSHFSYTEYMNALVICMWNVFYLFKIISYLCMFIIMDYGITVCTTYVRMAQQPNGHPCAIDTVRNTVLC